MVPSALRSLSVVMLLGAVSGTVVGTTPQSRGSAETGESSATGLTGADLDLSGRITLTSSSTALTDTPLSGVGGGSGGGLAIANPALLNTSLAASPLAGLHTTAQFRTAGEVAAAQVAADTAAQQQKADTAAKKKAAEKAAAKKKAAKKAHQAALKQAARKTPGNSRQIAREMVAKRGWKSGQFTCLVKLWDKESGWRHTADNPSSSAYGIPQALPGSKMSAAGKDWRTNPSTQIKWGLNYIEDRYGSPCGAWAHSRAHNWY